MDRECPPRQMPVRRFPRPRGDGPERRPLRHTFRRVSPPTRGWTRRRYAGQRPDHGFPAHAGMDPPALPAGAFTDRFPRPRGDGPRLYQQRFNAKRVSPPTRGWTRLEVDRDLVSTGFPAHAGMDRRGDRIRGHRDRFPRPRGDGPWGDTGDRTDPEVSPPTRGWTLHRRRRHGNSIGFPAHAGMDLKRGRCQRPSLGFPRPRGDGPSGARDIHTADGVSPPTRGWTATGDVTITTSSGFPAHAGMDLMPHRRGSCAAGFPAHAGMDLLKRPARSPSGSFPAHAGWTLGLPRHQTA